MSTPEQREANEALNAAVDATLRAYGYTGKELVTAGFVVLVDQRGWEEDGSSVSGVAYLFKDGDMPWTQAIGLVHAAQFRMEKDFMTEHDH